MEQVILWRTGDPFSESERHRESDLPDTGAVTATELGVLSAYWQPAVFFLSESERTRLLGRLEDHDPQRVLREAFNYAHRTEELRARVETVRISLPPKPALAKDTVRLELPPRSAS